VLHTPSIKPLDEEGILTVASHSRVLLTLDNHNIIGGLGSAVAEVLAEHRTAIPFIRVGLRDVYGKAATNAYLFRHFGLDPDQIAQVAVNHLGGFTAGQMIGSWKQTQTEQAGWGTDWKHN
jgi:transketolase